MKIIHSPAEYFVPLEAIIDQNGNEIDNQGICICWPETTRQWLVTSIAVLHDDRPVGDVDHEVAEDVGQQLLVHKFVDRPLPFVQNFHENTKITCIGNITSVRHRHFIV